MGKMAKGRRTQGGGRALITGSSRGVAWAARCAAVVATTCLMICLPLHMDISTPSHNAFASTWPAASSQGDVLVGFHQSYKSSKSTYAHSGVDIKAAAGSKVCSPLAGTVSFVGDVPAGDTSASSQSGLTMSAVSVLLESGKTVTLMPLEGIKVTEGDVLAEGEAVGVLAAAGDRSCATTHLHMGLKEDGVYYDPMSLFGISGTSASSKAPAAVGAAQGAGKTKASSRAKTRQSTASDGASAQVNPSLQPGSTQAQEEPSFGTISSESSSPVSLGTSQQEDASYSCPVFVSDLLAACQSQAAAFAGAFAELCVAAGIPVAAAILVCLAATLAVLAVIVSLVLASIRRSGLRFENKENDPLFAKRGGVNIFRLFPAPGTSFITRGRLAQRR